MLKDVFSRLRQQRRALSIAGHLALVSFAYFAAFALRFDFRIPPDQLRNYAGSLPYLLALRLLLINRVGLCRGYSHLVGVRGLREPVAATPPGSASFGTLRACAVPRPSCPRSVPPPHW